MPNLSIFSAMNAEKSDNGNSHRVDDMQHATPAAATGGNMFNNNFEGVNCVRTEIAYPLNHWEGVLF